jgi:hypothetical protein
MSYGMKIINQDNTLAYDSTSPGGVFVQFVVLPVGTNTSQQILDLPSQYRGNTLVAYPLNSGDHTYFLVQGNVESGQPPRIIWSNRRAVLDTVNRSQTILMILAK